MRKILICIFSFIVFSFSFLFVGCKNSNKGAVKLLSINQTGVDEASYFNSDNDSASFVSMRNAKNVSDSQKEENQYMLINESEIYFTLKITLDNPNNYYILDFSLESSDENFKVKINDKYILLTDLPSLRWNSDTNYFCELECCSNESSWKTTVEMKSLYYSDRTDGSNKYDGDITENNLLNIYRKNDGIELVEQSLFKFKVNVIHDNVDKNSLYFNDVKVNDGDILTLSLGDNVFKFNYIFDDMIIEGLFNKNLSEQYIYAGGGSWPSSGGGYINIVFDFDKVELYQYGEYKADAVKEKWGNNTHYSAVFRTVSTVYIPGNTYFMVYKDNIIIKITYTSNTTSIIEIIQGL